MSPISIVLLNWNGKHFLEKFLPGIVRFSPGCNIVVADNYSTDGSVEYVQKHHPQVRMIRFKENLGFCKGYNRALKQIESDYYVLLNTDVEVTQGWIDPVINLMENDNSIAVCQPKILSWHNKRSFEYAGAAGGFLDVLGYPFCRGRIFNTIEEDHGQYDDERQIFWASGASFFIRAHLFHRMGGFDERFFAHMEEIDLCWRLINAGHKIYFTAKSVVFHVGGGALPQGTPKKTFLNFRNNLLMLSNNLDRSEFWWKITCRFYLDYMAFLLLMLTGKLKSAMGIPKAHKEFVIMATKKKKLKFTNTLPKEKSRLKNLMYPSLILFDYFFKGKKEFKNLNF
jgi:GT2 family glycosyltransferase